jgi:5-methylcytosine-specific restriction enzyme A
MSSWSPDATFYQLKRWKLFAAQYLNNHPECCVPGCLNPATHADHIRAISKGGDGFSFVNIQPLCLSHHNQKTAIFDRPTKKTKKTRLTVPGCDEFGNPLDPLAHWNLKK